MGKKRSARSAPTAAITAERFTRLYRLLQILGAGPQTRAVLLRRLRVDVRGFYRDLELLRSSGIQVTLTEQRYTLTGKLETALARLPFPDPHLSYGDILQLVKGRTSAHKTLKQQVDQLLP